MSKINNIRLKNITESLKSTDIFAVYRDKTWIAVKGLRFDDLVFGDPTVLEASLNIVGDLDVSGSITMSTVLSDRQTASTTTNYDTSTFTTLDIDTASITATLTNAVIGRKVRVEGNFSTGSSTIGCTYRGTVNPKIYPDEVFEMEYDGSEWK